MESVNIFVKILHGFHFITSPIVMSPAPSFAIQYVQFPHFMVIYY